MIERYLEELIVNRPIDAQKMRWKSAEKKEKRVRIVDSRHNPPLATGCSWSRRRGARTRAVSCSWQLVLFGN